MPSAERELGEHRRLEDHRGQRGRLQQRQSELGVGLGDAARPGGRHRVLHRLFEQPGAVRHVQGAQRERHVGVGGPRPRAQLGHFGLHLRDVAQHVERRRVLPQQRVARRYASRVHRRVPAAERDVELPVSLVIKHNADAISDVGSSSDQKKSDVANH